MGFRWEDIRDSGQIMELTRLFATAFLLPETSLNWIIFVDLTTLFDTSKQFE